MSVALVTGSSGLIGSEAVRFLHARGLDVVGIDNNLRAYFFGPEGSVQWNTDALVRALPGYTHLTLDVRDERDMDQVLRRFSRAISLVVHCAAQPSHDWARNEPITDFTVNANGTLVLLEGLRRHAPDAVFLFLSTNKVYGDEPNRLPLVEQDTRWEIDPRHPYFEAGIDESMSIDRSTHSLFGVSKVAADLMVQEYGRCFGMRTACFRCGCLTGPAHSGTELHGFLAYLVKCAVAGKPYTVFGYKGKQVRDNIHSSDLVQALWSFFRDPRPAGVYNMGGSRTNSCSVLEAADLVEELSGRRLDFTISETARQGDHIWWITDVGAFRRDFPDWDYAYDLKRTVSEIVDATRERLP